MGKTMIDDRRDGCVSNPCASREASIETLGYRIESIGTVMLNGREATAGQGR